MKMGMLGKTRKMRPKSSLEPAFKLPLRVHGDGAVAWPSVEGKEGATSRLTLQIWHF
jgi:hypothetical protein